MVSRTREKLIEVARQLFAYKGVENTTMNDIAAASEKGRRTIYTYFKNKREIYNAVIEQQSNQIVDRLRSIVDRQEMTPIEKLRSYLLELFKIISQSAPRAEGYRRLLLRDHKRVTKIFRLALDKERALFNELIRQGVDSGMFDRCQAERLPAIISCVISSSYYYTQPEDPENEMSGIPQDHPEQIIDFLVEGIKACHNDNQHKC